MFNDSLTYVRTSDDLIITFSIIKSTGINTFLNEPAYNQNVL